MKNKTTQGSSRSSKRTNQNSQSMKTTKNNKNSSNKNNGYSKQGSSNQNNTNKVLHSRPPKKDKMEINTSLTVFNTGDIRLNKFISDSGICSRREADRYMNEGRVLVNRKKAGVGSRISNKDEVLVNGRLIEHADNNVYIAFNKPVGITSTTETNVKDNIIDYIEFPMRIFPIGRLDKLSEGLIFLTNDGDIVNKILRAGNNHEKEYIVEVNQKITDDFITRMANGVPIDDVITKKCKVYKESDYVFRIILTEGLNRQIRKMADYFGYSVTKLKRIRIMNIELGNLHVGTYRFLTEDEINQIKSLVHTSSKTEEASRRKKN